MPNRGNIRTRYVDDYCSWECRNNGLHGERRCGEPGARYGELKRKTAWKLDGDVANCICRAGNRENWCGVEILREEFGVEWISVDARTWVVLYFGSNVLLQLCCLPKGSNCHRPKRRTMSLAEG